MSRSYPWQNTHRDPLPIPSAEERAEVAAALKAYTASRRAGHNDVVSTAEPDELVHVPDCAECFDVGVARCGEHGLLLFRRAASVSANSHGDAPATETCEISLEVRRGNC